MRVVHPAVDEWGDGYAVYASSALTVRLTDTFVTFLIGAAEENRRPVLVSRVDARVSAHVSLAMRRAGGYWMVQARDGSSFDAMTGYQVAAVPELWRGTGAEGGRARLASFESVPQGVAGSLSFDMHCLRRAEPRTQAGRLAQTVTAALGSAGLDSWGEYEPLLDPWDLGEVTRLARAGMPQAGPFLAGGPDGTFCQVRMSRTKLGLLENAVGAVPLAEPTNDLEALVGWASGMLEQAAESFNVTVGFCSVVDYDPDFTQGARARLPEAPLAMIAGPKVVRDLGLDLDDLRARNDVVVFGRAKTPGVIVRFSRPDVGLWAQLVDVVREAGIDRFAAVAGLPAEALPAPVLPGGPGAH